MTTKTRNMKDTGYTMVAATQKQLDDRDRLMIAAHMMAAMIPHCDIHRKQAAQELATKAVEFTDELLKAVK